MTLTMAPAACATFDHGADVGHDIGVAAGLERADVDDHVELRRAVADRLPASKTFAAVAWPPCGKPIVVPTSTSVPARIAAARGTAAGLMQTEATSYSRREPAAASTTASSSSGRSSEWSIVLAMSRQVRAVDREGHFSSLDVWAEDVARQKEPTLDQGHRSSRSRDPRVR